ncbi:MAG: hypothetical protein KA144_06905 [Xanthomonadaceae bacterium]|nr:hypothetical protein [Xanthomonadaceae bacterium]
MSDDTPAPRDVEIYIEDCDEAALLSALCEALGDCVRTGLDSDAEDAMRFYAFPHTQLVLSLYGKGFSSCWLRGGSPWQDDVAFARAMAPRLKRRVFCDPGAYYPDVHPLSDAFLLIDTDGERIVDIEQIEGLVET